MLTKHIFLIPFRLNFHLVSKNYPNFKFELTPFN